MTSKRFSKRSSKSSLKPTSKASSAMKLRSSKMQTRSSTAKITAAKFKAANNLLKVAKVTPDNKPTKSAEAIKATDLQQRTGSLISDTEITDLLCNFTLFPKLPLELRFEIFMLALPNFAGKTPRILIGKVLGESRNDNLVFAPARKYYDAAYETRPRLNDLSLSAVCKESREVFLKNTTGCLPAGEDRMIRFDDSTIIHIENFAHAFQKGFDDILTPTSISMLKCLSTIKNLSIPLQVLAWHNPDPLKQYPHGLCSMVSPFTNLRQLYGRQNPYTAFWVKLTKLMRDRLLLVAGNLKTETKLALMNKANDMLWA